MLAIRASLPVNKMYLIFLGAIWPHPKTQVISKRFFTVRPSNFNFESIGQTCEILEQALERYGKIIGDQLRRYRHKSGGASESIKWRNTPNFLVLINERHSFLICKLSISYFGCILGSNRCF